MIEETKKYCCYQGKCRKMATKTLLSDTTGIYACFQKNPENMDVLTDFERDIADHLIN
jgi:hypothetical protein